MATTHSAEGAVATSAGGEATRVDVVVIGAGLAGLSAAQALLQNAAAARGSDGTDAIRAAPVVAVLEARHRIGGRLVSAPVGGHSVDLGAAFIHGTEDNPLVAALDAAGGISVEFSPGNPWTHPRAGDFAVVRPSKPAVGDGAGAGAGASDSELPAAAGAAAGYDVIDDAEVEAATTLLAELLNDATPELVDPDADSESVSARECLVAALKARDTAAVPALTRQIVDMLLWGVECWFGTSLYRFAMSEFPPDGLMGDFPGPHCMVKGGMAQLLDPLVPGIDVSLNTRVSAVDYTCGDATGGRVVVTAETRETDADGEVTGTAASVRVYHAHHVIVTVPLGVLKGKAPESAITFTPPLPDAKAEAIRRLKMGAYVKVFIAFKHPFWPADRKFIARLGHPDPLKQRPAWAGSDAELAAALTARDEAASAVAGDGAAAVDDAEAPPLSFPVFTNYMAVKGVPVLQGTLIGEDAAHARGMSDDAIVDCALESLRHMFGSAVAPPEGSRVTHWDTDPFSCGAYSFAPLDSPPEDHDALSAPLYAGAESTRRAVVSFAGEATDGEYEGSLHAALLTGRRGAEEALAGLARA